MKHPIHKVCLTVRGGYHEKDIARPETPVHMVYQRVRKGFGNIPTAGRYDLQLRRQVAITDLKSPAQLALRARFAAAVLEWQGLDLEVRQVWRVKAKKLYMTGFNLFISDFTKFHDISEYE